MLIAAIEEVRLFGRVSQQLPSQKRLIVNADDFGLHKSINSAIAQAHRTGIVTSTSLMPGQNMAPAFDHALGLLEDLPNLDVGLHFTIVGSPGQPEDHIAFLQAKLMGDFPSASIETMLRRQLDTLLDKNLSVSHIDSHQHLHALPSIMRVVAKVAKEYGIPSVRLPRENGGYAGASKARIASAKVLALLSYWSKKELDRAGVRYPDHFAGMAISGSLNPLRLIALLGEVQPGVTEILCHPGADNESLSDEFSWGYDWLSELIAVTDPSVATYMNQLEIVPTTFSKFKS